MADAEAVPSPREVLEEERGQLRSQLHELGVATYDENFADSGQVAAEQGENRALVNQLAETLEDVERALANLHEVAHGAVANFFGDDTAKRAGRLTLNPIRHIDPFGTLVLPLLLSLSGVG